MLKPSLLAVACAAALLTSLQAGQPIAMVDNSKDKIQAVDEFPYVAGAKELELSFAGFGSIGTRGNDTKPDVGNVNAEVRFGVMLTTPSGDSFLRGNLELLLNAFGGYIYEGPGDYLVGAELLLRYNFVQPDCKVVPFIQVGGGGAYSDAADDNQTQRLIGSDLSFSLQAEIGLRYHFSRNVALTTSVLYRHISNADTADRNVGLNSLGGRIGLSLFF